MRYFHIFLFQNIFTNIGIFVCFLFFSFPLWQCTEEKLRAELATSTDSIPVRALTMRPGGGATVTYYHHQQAEEVCNFAFLCFLVEKMLLFIVFSPTKEIDYFRSAKRKIGFFSVVKCATVFVVSQISTSLNAITLICYQYVSTQYLSDVLRPLSIPPPPHSPPRPHAHSLTHSDSLTQVVRRLRRFAIDGRLIGAEMAAAPPGVFASLPAGAGTAHTHSRHLSHPPWSP